MKKQLINYETMIRIAKAISHSKDPEEVVLITVEGIKTALDAKGCALFLVNRKTHELEMAGSYGLSDKYVNKGPLSALQSIAQSLEEGPVAIYDVSDDPRIQYPEEATEEGIASILSVPLIIRGKLAGAFTRLHFRTMGIHVGRCKFCPGTRSNGWDGDRDESIVSGTKGND